MPEALIPNEALPQADTVRAVCWSADPRQDAAPGMSFPGLPPGDAEGLMRGLPADGAGQGTAGDSTAAHAVTAPGVPAGFTAATPGEVFGAASQCAPATGATMAPPARDVFSGQTVYQVSVLVCLLGYVFILHYFRSSLLELLKMLRSKIYTEKLLDDANHIFSQFLNVSSMLGMAVCAVFLLRMAELVLPVAWLSAVPQWLRAAAVPCTAGAVALIAGYRWLVMGMAGNITLQPGFMARLSYLRKMTAALAAIFMTPVLLLSSLGDRGTQIAIPATLALVAAVTAGFVLHKTFMLFGEQKISFLHWFLYLCTVEIFPVSLAAALLVKNIG